MTANDLIALKKQIEEAQVKRARLEGTLSSIEASMKSEFGVSTLAEAEALLSRLQADITAQEIELESLLAQIEKARS